MLKSESRRVWIAHNPELLFYPTRTSISASSWSPSLMWSEERNASWTSKQFCLPAHPWGSGASSFSLFLCHRSCWSWALERGWDRAGFLRSRTVMPLSNVQSPFRGVWQYILMYLYSCSISADCIVLAFSSLNHMSLVCFPYKSGRKKEKEVSFY